MLSTINSLGNLVFGVALIVLLVKSARRAGAPAHTTWVITGAIALWLAAAAIVDNAIQQLRPADYSNYTQMVRVALISSIATPVLAAAFVTRRAGFASLVAGISTPQLLLLNTARILLGGVIVAQGAVGNLPGDFAFEAGWGDVISGALAIVVAVAWHLKFRHARLVTAIWSVIGLLDLVNALRLGVLSIVPFRLLTGRAEIGLIPFFGVPALLIIHAVIAKRLLQRSAQSN